MATRGEIDAWIVAVSPRAVAYARSLLKNPHDTEDVVQGCFCRLLTKNYDLLNDGSRLLMAAVTNACINLKTRRRSLLSFAVNDDVVIDPADPAAWLPEQLAVRGELSDAVTSALRELPETQRAAVELRAMGFSQEEIGGILNVSTSHAGVLIHRGRAALATTLKAYVENVA